MIRRLRFDWRAQGNFLCIGVFLPGGRVVLFLPCVSLEIRWVRW